MFPVVASMSPTITSSTLWATRWTGWMSKDACNSNVAASMKPGSRMLTTTDRREPRGQADKWTDYKTHASIEDNSLFKVDTMLLEAFMKSRGVDYHDCFDKDDLVRRCVDNGINVEMVRDFEQLQSTAADQD